MSDNEKVLVSHKVPKQDRERAQENAEYGEMSELVRDIYARKANPNDVADRDDIDKRLRELRGDRDELRLELRRATEELEAKIDSKETQIARLEERKDAARSKADRFQGALNQLVSLVENGGHIWSDHPGVVEAADTIDETADYVLHQVREEVPEAGDEQFEKKTVHGGEQ